MIPAGRVFIIAEAGVNHNGSLDLAKRLVEEAQLAGADCIKFQTFRAERLASRMAEKAAYQKATTGGSAKQYEMLKGLELGEPEHRALLAQCDACGMAFLSSPFDEESADLLEALGVSAFKVPSGELTNHPFLHHLASKGKPLIVSTGMATLAEVAEAVEVMTSAGNRRLHLLHCVTEYPAPPAEINLRAMSTLEHAFGFPVGYSDHTPGLEVAIAAAALGATIIEKHMTLSRDMVGPDHRASLEPAEFAAMVTAIRTVESALGDGFKAPAPSEVRNIDIARKSVVAARDIARGEQLTRDNVAIKRPGSGVQPKDLAKLLGLRATAAIEVDRPITWEDVK